MDSIEEGDLAEHNGTTAKAFCEAAVPVKSFIKLMYFSDAADNIKETAGFPSFSKKYQTDSDPLILNWRAFPITSHIGWNDKIDNESRNLATIAHF